MHLLHALDPEVVAIVASGYADDDILAHHEAHGFRGRLQKPFDMTALSVELARVLNGDHRDDRRPESQMG